MKKIFGMIFLLTMLLLTSCTGGADTSNGSGSADGAGDAEQTIKDNVGMTATVIAISDKIEVNVIEGDHGATGIYWINTSEQTAFVGANGEPITRDDIKAGDTVEIRYTGQVMMSYPPQIVAVRIAVVG